VSGDGDLRTVAGPAERRALHDRIGTVVGTDRDGRGLRIGVAAGSFNGGITVRLLDGALAGLAACGVDRADVRLAWAPGAFELPLVAQAFAPGVDAVVCVGAVIRGATGHYDFVAGECAAGLQRVQLDFGLPVVFGVLTTDTVEQALERSCRPGPGDAATAEGGSAEAWSANKGYEAAVTAVEMARLLGSPELGTAHPRRDGKG